MSILIDFYLVAADRQTHRLLRGRSYVIGRDPSAEIPVHDVLISRRHAEVTWENNNWVVIDLNSRNGVFINGERINGRRALNDQDRLQAGGQVFSFQMVPAGADPGSLGQHAPDIDNEATMSPGMNLADMAGAGAAFSGELGPGGLLELLQFFAQTGKSGRVDVLDASALLLGSIWISKGAICETYFRMETGMSALLRLLKDRCHRFAFHADDKPPAEPSISGSATSILMDIARQLDETHK